MQIFFRFVEFIFGVGAIGSILVLALTFIEDLKTIFAADSMHDQAVSVTRRAEQAKHGVAG